jgi:hypothetical protein
VQIESPIPLSDQSEIPLVLSKIVSETLADAGARLRLATTVHEIGHLLGFRRSDRAHSGSIYTIKMLAAGDGMVAHCDHYEELDPQEKWFGIVGGVVVGAGYLSRIFDGTKGERDWKKMHPIDVLAWACKASTTSLSDIRTLIESTHPIGKVEMGWIVSCAVIGCELADPDHLAHLAAIDLAVRGGGIEIGTEELDRFYPADIGKLVREAYGIN